MLEWNIRDHLPAIIDDDDRPFRYSGRAQRAEDSAKLEIFIHEVRAGVLGAKDQIDTQTLADAARYALQEEIRVLEDGQGWAGNSQAARELVARKVNLVANTDDRRLNRRFR